MDTSTDGLADEIRGDGYDPCHYGLPRAQCHIMCGRACRPARAARKLGLKSPAIPPRHSGCGTAECCQTCDTAETNLKETA